MTTKRRKQKESKSLSLRLTVKDEQIDNGAVLDLVLLEGLIRLLHWQVQSSQCLMEGRVGGNSRERESRKIVKKYIERKRQT